VAFAQTSSGVLQSAAHSANITGVVTQSDGTPVAGGNVMLTGPTNLSTKSDAHGLFDFVAVPWGTYKIEVSFPTLGVASRSITVNSDLTVVIQYSSQTTGGMKIIAQTSAHINATSANVASVSPSDYAFQGNTSWNELLNAIPGVTAGGSLFGGSSENAAIPGNLLEPVILSINGALPYETATLLDGMPLVDLTQALSYDSTGFGVDLADLPLNAFDAADVVRGPGADSPSIVDSVGGTFALHAPGIVNQNQFEFSASNDPWGGIVANAKAAVSLQTPLCDIDVWRQR
jgi:hypothetical protein